MNQYYELTVRYTFILNSVLKVYSNLPLKNRETCAIECPVLLIKFCKSYHPHESSKELYLRRWPCNFAHCVNPGWWI